MKTFTSPKTGNTYEVVAKQNHRVVAFVDGQPVWADEPTWDIFLNGKPIQFALSEEAISRQVLHYEGFGDGVWSSARD